MASGLGPHGLGGRRLTCYVAAMPNLTVDGESLHYAVSGSAATTLVLIHGSGGDHTTWEPQLAGLASVATVVALDLPGHGSSSGSGCDTVADYAERISRFLAELGRGRVVLGGHSLGGAIVQTVAVDRPELLRGLVLVGTGARLRVMPELFAVLDRDYAEGVRFMTEHAWGASAPAALKEAGRKTVSATPPLVTRADFTACDGFDVMDRLGAIALPTLVLVGEEDRLTPPKYAEFLVRRIAQARLVRVPGAGHFVSLERPGEINRAIADFLAGLG
jgi:pimeloyl-ACP methyl ester carboxylesterase